MNRKPSALIGGVAVAGRLVWLLAFAATVVSAAELERTGGPYVPTPQIVVDQMLRMANVGANDFVLDLGSGDGVIVLTAAQQYKARGLGVDIDPALVKLSNANAKKLGIDDRAAFEVQDVFKADVSRASVITLYLLPSMMNSLRGKIFLEAKPGTRVVSHDYTFGEWQPDNYVTLEVPEKEKINGTPRATIYLWVVPAKVAGKWQVRIDGGEAVDVTFRQDFQSLQGRAATGDKSLALPYASLRGSDVSFTIGAGQSRRVFTGTVAGDVMRGTVEVNGRTAKWTASKL